MEKYKELLNVCRMYHKNQNADRELLVQMACQDDPIVHNLFISIVRLINFFLEQSAQS